MMLEYNTRLPSFVIPKNYGSLTHETRIKDAVNMEDLICLLATVRTLNSDVNVNTVSPMNPSSIQHWPFWHNRWIQTTMIFFTPSKRPGLSNDQLFLSRDSSCQTLLNISNQEKIIKSKTSFRGGWYFCFDRVNNVTINIYVICLC